MVQNTSVAINCPMWLILKFKTVFDWKSHVSRSYTKNSSSRVIPSYFLRVLLKQNEGFFVNFRRKCFKTPEKLRIAVCGSLFGVKQFLAVYFQFRVFDIKMSFSSNLLLISVLVTFCPIILVFVTFVPKYYKTTE